MASLTSNNEFVLQDDLDGPSKDLLARLLVVDPQKRLHSLRALSTIAFFKGYSFEDVQVKKVSKLCPRGSHIEIHSCLRLIPKISFDVW